MIAFAKEPFSEWFMEARDLFQRHWREVANDREIFALDPDYKRIFLMEQAGVTTSYTVRDDGKLVGYVCFVVTQHLHYRRMKVAYADVIYMAPEHRGPRLAKRMMEYAERDLVATGVDRIQYHMKKERDRVEGLMRLMGYEAREVIYEKTVTRAARAREAA